MDRGEDSLTKPTVVEGSGRTSDRAATTLDITAGTEIGRYVITSQIGAGGMGVVYSALDPQLNRKVAIKIVTSGDQSRMLREAQSLARLSHPNVVAVHDVGTIGTRVFIAMELVEGMTLVHWVRSRTWREIVDVYTAAGRGLAAAHAAGIVHRDVKPGNVIIGRDGRVRVLDFGLARSAGEIPPAAAPSDDDALRADLTRTGSVVGTPVYMAPEAFRGVPVDAAGDQFSFCVALYEALYTELPFEGTWVDAKDPPKLRPAPARTQVPAWIRDVVMRGLSVAPAARFPSMDALVAALGADPARKRRRWLIAGAAVIVLGGGGALGAMATRHHAAPDSHPCAAAAPLGETWTPASRDRVHAGFAATKRPDAEQLFARTVEALDRTAASWLDAHDHVCSARPAADATHGDVALLYRLACLDRQKQDLAALVRLLENPGSLPIDKVAHAVHELPIAQVCEDASSLSLPDPPPAEQRARVDKLQQRLSAARALRAAGEVIEAEGMVPALIDDARALGYAPLLAECLYVRGELETHDGKFKEAAPDLEEAEVTATAGHNDALAARAAAVLVAAHRQDPHAVVDAVIANAQSWVTRTGDAEARYDLENSLSQYAIDTGHIEQALAHIRTAIEIARHLYGELSFRVVANHGSEAFVLGLLGRNDEAIASLEQVLHDEDKLLDPDNPEIQADLDNLAVSLVAVGRTDEARAALERALKMPKAIEGLSAALGCDMCRTLVAAGQPEDAIHWGKDCLDRLAQLGVERSNLVINEDPLAMAYLGARRFKEADALARKCIDDFRKDRAKDTPDMAACLTVEGTAQLELGNAKRAVTILEPTLALLDGQATAPGVRGNIQFQLARALVASHGDRERAHALATAAHDELARYPFKKPLLGELEAWRARTK